MNQLRPYNYTPDGKLATRTWARGSVASYAYDATGRLTGIDYSDTTPDVSFTYDRLGRQLSAIVAGVSTNTYAYDPETLALSVETQNGVVIARATDSLGRAAGFSVAGVGDPGSPYAVSYGYDAYGRFAQVSNFQFQVSYSYLSGSSLVSGMTASTSHAWTRSYEPQRNLIAAVENTYGETVISRFDYVNDAIGRRTAISRSGTAFTSPVQDSYGYNARSEVTSARRSLASNPNQEVRGFSYDYAYDPIGNRTSSTEYDHENNALVSSYTANELNQYSQRTVPGYAGVRGSATNTATVTVNGNAAWRLGEYFYGGDEADNTASAVMKELAITAVVNPPGTNTPDLVESITGRVFVAQSPEAFSHDEDGNLTQDGRFTYTWDGENRLIAVETRADLPASVPRVKVTYAYDNQSRRIGKVVSNLEGETWTVAESRTFLHDGWNMIREIQHSNIPSFHSSTNSYVWGLDLSGSLQGAGGVGGLLAVSMSGQYYFPCHDANGNITAYVNESGSVVAEYAYDAFGGLLAQTGSMADAFRFRFSTKYFDAETDLYYYGYRFYSPELRRWLNRDPIEEEGGLNLYRFCHNNALNAVDLFGLNPEFGVMAAFAYKFGSDVMKPEVSINLVGSTKWSTCDHMTFNADIGHRVMVNGMIGMPRNSSQVYTETYIHVSGTYGTGSSPGLPFYFNGSQWYSALKDRHESSFSLGTTFYSSEAVGENVRMANLRVQGGGRWFLNYHNDQAPGGVKLLSDGGDRGWTGGGMLGFSIGGGQQGIISFDDYSGRASSPNKYDRGNPNVQTAYSKSLNQAQWTLGVSGGGNGMIGVAIDAPWWLNLQNLIHWSISPSAGAFEYPEEIELKLHISGSIGSNRR